MACRVQRREDCHEQGCCAPAEFKAQKVAIAKKRSCTRSEVDLPPDVPSLYGFAIEFDHAAASGKPQPACNRAILTKRVRPVREDDVPPYMDNVFCRVHLDESR